MNKPSAIALFASGSGSNAETIIRYFSEHPSIRVGLVLTNNPEAGVLERAARLGIPTMVFSRDELYGNDVVLKALQQHTISFVVLAGFLWLVPAHLIAAYPGRILNIHPALLPRFGGKGMYGMRVHEAVKASGETQTGITIHLVNEHYDEGAIIFQARCEVEATDTPADIARKVQELEHKHFPQVIENVILQSQPTQI